MLHRQNFTDSVRKFVSPVPCPEKDLTDREPVRLRRDLTTHKSKILTLIKYADGFNLDYTDEYAFTDAMSSMIADNLGDTQGLIGQVSASCKEPTSQTLNSL